MIGIGSELITLLWNGFSTIHGLGSLGSLGSQHHQYLLGSQDELGSHRFQKACWKQWEPSSFWEPREPRKTRQRGGSPGSPDGESPGIQKDVDSTTGNYGLRQCAPKNSFYQKLSLSNS